MTLSNSLGESVPSPCDLLHHEPLPRLDPKAAVEALSFGFAGGDGDVFASVLDPSPAAPSTFEAGDFRHDLFLDSFVHTCLPVTVGGRRRDINAEHLLGLLCAPPSDERHTAFRQDILRELLASDHLRRNVEELYLWLLQFRDLMGRSSVGAQEGIQRRLSILTSIRSVVESLGQGFSEASSGLHRLSDYGAVVAEGPGYRRLCELLDYEKNRAEVDVRLSVGFDGRIRTFQTIERRENRSNAFYASPFGRAWSSLCLFLSGYRASRGEVLSRLVDGVFSGLEPTIVFFFSLIGDLEFYLAGLGFADQAQAAGLSTCLPQFVKKGRRSYENLFNPWLGAELDPCRPCSLSFAESEHLVFITGPNSGGKTRLLQSLSLCQLLGQCGLLVPAKSAQLLWVPGLFASLIEQSSAEQKEGRLGTELQRIRRLFQHLRAGSLVVVDELCSGTNPSEGETLMNLVLEVLAELKPQAYVATHFLEFTARLQSEELRGQGMGSRFLQTQLDDNEQPTYLFVEGVANTSLAHRVAERLGVTRESLRALLAKNNPTL